MIRSWLRISLLNFLIAAVMGLVLRYAFVVELSWVNFRYLLHGHSHVAMLGWLYLALFSLIVHSFLPKDKQQTRFLTRLFWLTQVSVIGMAVAFPLYGYGPVSITFSSLHVVFSYAFAYYVFRHLPRRKKPAFSFLKAALWFMILSTLALWAIPPIILFGSHGSALYYAAIQFFLHFQFNGWFLFGGLALFFHLAEQRSVVFSGVTLRWFFRLLVLATFFTYALAVAWSNPIPLVFGLNSIGVLVQLIAALLFVQLVWPHRRMLSGQFWTSTLLSLSFASFLAKLIMQSAVVFPVVATAAYTIRNYVIGFIHLILLGAMTFFLLAFCLDQNILRANSRTIRIGLVTLIAGFILTEVILFLQGTFFWGAMGFLPYYYVGLFATSCLLPVGVLLLVVHPDSR